MKLLLKKINLFLQHLHNLNFSIHTIDAYKTALLQMARHCHFEDNTLDITPFRHAYKKLNKKSTNQKLAAIRSFIAFLQTDNPHIKLIGDEGVKAIKTLPKPLKNSLIKSSLQNTTAQQYIAICLLYGLGLRISELAQLKLEQIQTHFLTVRGKRNKQREVPINAQLQKNIQDYILKDQPQVFLLEHKNRPLTAMQIRYRVQKAFKAIGVKATPHMLRHSFATQTINNGANVKIISQILGHKNLDTTKIYTKISQNLKKKNYKMAHPLCRGKH